MLSKASAFSHGLVMPCPRGSPFDRADTVFSAILFSTTITSVTYERSSLLGMEMSLVRHQS